MLKESEKKFRNLFEKHSTVKLIIDPENGNIVEENEAVEKIYGWSKDKLLNMNISDINILSSEQNKARMLNICQKKLSSFDSKHQTGDNSVKYVEIFSSPIEINGKTFLHSIIHDITGKCRIEEQCHQMQRMEPIGNWHEEWHMITIICSQLYLVI